MKKMEKRLRRDSVKVERYTCAECLPYTCKCSSVQYARGNDEQIAAEENKSYRRG